MTRLSLAMTAVRALSRTAQDYLGEDNPVRAIGVFVRTARRSGPYTDLPQARSLRSQRSVDCIMATSASLHELRMLKRSAPRTVARCGVGIRSILFARCSWNSSGSLRSNALCVSYCKLWLNLGHGHGSPAERKMAMVIGRPLLKLNASTRGPLS